MKINLNFQHPPGRVLHWENKLEMSNLEEEKNTVTHRVEWKMKRKNVTQVRNCITKADFMETMDELNQEIRQVNSRDVG